MISDTLRLELEPFGIKVIDLRTAIVKTNLIKNLRENRKAGFAKVVDLRAGEGSSGEVVAPGAV